MRCGVVWCGVVRCGVVRCSVVWCGVLVPPGPRLHGLAWRGRSLGRRISFRPGVIPVRRSSRVAGTIATLHSLVVAPSAVKTHRTRPFRWSAPQGWSETNDAARARVASPLDRAPDRPSPGRRSRAAPVSCRRSDRHTPFVFVTPSAVKTHRTRPFRWSAPHGWAETNDGRACPVRRSFRVAGATEIRLCFGGFRTRNHSRLVQRPGFGCRPGFVRPS